MVTSSIVLVRNTEPDTSIFSLTYIPYIYIYTRTYMCLVFRIKLHAKEKINGMNDGQHHKEHYERM
jgi:hypothetical protein